MANGSQQQLEVQESQIVGAMFQEINQLKETHAEFFAWFEDVDPDSAPRGELVDLMANSPNDAVKYFLFGKYTMRLQLASITGREFK